MGFQSAGQRLFSFLNETHIIKWIQIRWSFQRKYQFDFSCFSWNLLIRLYFSSKSWNSSSDKGMMVIFNHQRCAQYLSAVFHSSTVSSFHWIPNSFTNTYAYISQEACDVSITQIYEWKHECKCFIEATLQQYSCFCPNWYIVILLLSSHNSQLLKKLICNSSSVVAWVEHLNTILPCETGRYIFEGNFRMGSG